MEELAKIYESTADDSVKIILISATRAIKTAVDVVRMTQTIESFDVKENVPKHLTDRFPNVQVVIGTVVSVDGDKRIVTVDCSTGDSDSCMDQMKIREFRYGKLCVCTGSRPKRLGNASALPAEVYANHVLDLRDTESVNILSAKLVKTRRILLVGNGGIALELVQALNILKILNDDEHGKEEQGKTNTTPIELVWAIKDSYIGNTFFDASASAFLLPGLNITYGSPTGEETATATKAMHISENDTILASAITVAKSTVAKEPVSLIESIGLDNMKCKVSSVLNRNKVEYGRKHMFDGDDSTCWNSDSGLPQWVQIDFKTDAPVCVHSISITFQGGFVAQECVLRGRLKGEKKWKTHDMKGFSSFFDPEDNNDTQRFALETPAMMQRLRIEFKRSTDFYGRVTIYHLDIIGLKNQESHEQAKKETCTRSVVEERSAISSMKTAAKVDSGAGDRGFPVKQRGPALGPHWLSTFSDALNGKNSKGSMEMISTFTPATTAAATSLSMAIGNRAGGAVATKAVKDAVQAKDKAPSKVDTLLSPGMTSSTATENSSGCKIILERECQLASLSCVADSSAFASESEGTNGSPAAVRAQLTNGQVYNVDMVINATGVVPNINFMLADKCEGNNERKTATKGTSSSSSASSPCMSILAAQESDCGCPGGLLVNDMMQVLYSSSSSSNERVVVATDSIYAAGDCCSIANTHLSSTDCSGSRKGHAEDEDERKHWFQMRLWTQARSQGIYAARSMAGMVDELTRGGGIAFELFAHVTRFFSFKVILLGRYNGQRLEELLAASKGKGDGDAEVGEAFAHAIRNVCATANGLSQHGIEQQQEKDQSDNGVSSPNRVKILLRVTPNEEYIKLILLDGCLIGALLVGDTDLEETCENLILNGLNVHDIADNLLHPEFDMEDYFD